ncbi:hypothetical protein ACSFA0_22455 [Variovorax sp. LT1P1]|uniref:ADP-ribosyltransferase-containing protein n=1 Tax=Variovorax sp. LT1P1 TaxID=3443730 RepID=UPI003F459158
MQRAELQDLGNFDRWFGGSQVTDADGRPLMLFHGTFHDFTAFADSEDGGFHFGSESAAGRRLADLGGDEGADGARVMPVFLAIRNPKTLATDPRGPESWQAAIALAKAEGHDGIRYTNSVEFDEDIDGNAMLTESWVAFEPAQIKGAIGNSGAYDRSDPDLTDRRACAAQALSWLQGCGGEELAGVIGSNQARPGPSHATIPPFRPRFMSTPGMGDAYDDGRVVGAVDFSEHEGLKAIVISEWTSRFPGLGHTTQALQWIREQGWVQIVANGVGLVENGVGDVATGYWLHLREKGLVDVLVDDDGHRLAPTPRTNRPRL